ncbi:MAG: twitch domain-containing radical SAM protein [Rhodobacteraceae bacterium]|nr:twitch domain-containing radical SAM protein [Paracoccaceae bacterium]
MPTEINALPVTFCPRLWNELSIRPDGTFAPCCVFLKRIQIDDENALIEDSDPDASLAEIPDLLDLRCRSLAGETIDRCKICYDAEKNGGKSQRKWAVQGAISRFPDAGADEILGNFKKNPGEHTSVHMIFGNLCNFRCRMCQPLNSSKIAADKVHSTLLEKLTGGLCTKEGLNQREKAWHNNPETFRRQILPRLKSVRRLNLSAGEPLMVPILRKLLATDLSDDVARNCDLHITTNGSYCDDAILNSLARFKSHNISVSIDGVGATCEYIRKGAKWEEILANSRRFAANGASFRYNLTIQTYNILELPKIDKFLREEPYQIESAHAGWVVRPYFLDSCKLPKVIKEQCCEILQGYLDELENEGKTSAMVAYAINRLKNGQGASDENSAFKAFCHYTRELDLDRGDRLSVASPKLFEILSTQPDFKKHYGPIDLL